MLKCWSEAYYVNQANTYKGQLYDQISITPPPNHALEHHWQLTKPRPSTFFASS